MPCLKCQQIPNTHSFQSLGKTTRGITLLYSKPYDALEKRFTEETIQCYYKHLDEMKGKWVWLFDAPDLHKLETPNISLLRSFYKGVEERYKDSLQCIYILHPNWKLQTILGMIRPFMRAEARQRLDEQPSLLTFVELGMDLSLAKSLLRLEKKVD
jgi:hypothetical protein